MSLVAGTRLGPYEIQSAIGAGGMGEVYKAHDTRLGRAVAIKVLPPGAATDPERRRRFEQEARAVAALNHPHICTLYDIGRDGDTDFLVMELVAGETLAARLTKGPLPCAQVIEFATQMAQALAIAHGEGIVHRDLKPGNVMLTESGVKLLDFGLAKAMDRVGATGEDPSAVSTQAAVTTPGAVLGTLPYMAPEQVRGLPSDHRTDIFAFGCVLYEMLSGKRAFEGDTAADTMSAILTKDPRPLADLGIAVPTELLGIVRRCLAKRPDDRFSSAHELALALEAAPQPNGQFRSRRRPSARRRRLVAAAAVTALAGLGATLVLWAPWRAPARPPASDNHGPVSVSSAVPKPETRVAVALFENRTGDPTLDLVGQQAADWITDGLTSIGTADVALPASYALGSGAADPAARAAYTDPRKVAEVTGASVVVSGTYELEGEEFVFRARLSEPRTGRLLKAFEPARGSRARPSDVLQTVNRAVVGAVAVHFDASYDPRTGYPPSLEAYREIAQASVYWYRDWDVVIRHLERALELDPQYARPRLQLALARIFVGDYGKARQELDALGSSEDRLTAWEKQVLRAYRAHLAGQAWEYLDAAREQARLAPGMSQGPFDAAVMLYCVNHPAEAEGLLAPWDGKEVDGGWATSEIRSHVLHMAGRFDDQLAVASRARERYPTLFYFHEHQAAAQAALGRFGDLERTVTDALTSQAGSGTPGLVMLVAAMELRAHGHRQESVAMAVRAGDWYAAQPVDRFVALQTPNRGIEWYRSRPRDIRKRLREEQAMALGWAGRWSDVRLMVDTLAREDPANVDYMGWLGVLAARSGNAAEARRVADRLRTLGRPYTFGSDTYWRGCIAAQLGERQQAVELLQQAFTEGYWFQTQLHRTIDLEPLWEYPPFVELLRPKG